LNWGNRITGIQREVVMFEPDIVCLQEVQFNSGEEDSSSHFQSDIEPFFSSQGFAYEYKKKTGSKVDGCAIFYKKEKFKMLDVKFVEFRSDTIQALSSDTVGICGV